MKKHILIVDDEPLICDTLALLLQSQGLCTSIANNGYQAIQVLQNAPVDLILSDYEMPLLNGLDLYTKVRELDSHIPFIIFTASTLPHHPDDIIYLTKPERYSCVLEVILKALGVHPDQLSIPSED